jgi:two-component system, OmpR family, response regulator
MITSSEVRTLSVLVVDDDHDTADSCALLLRMSGHDARVAYDATQAMAQLAGWAPAAVLMDIMLPGCNGMELREQICRSTVNRPRSIAVTGIGTRHDLEPVLAAGFDHVLLKPVDLEELGTILGAI